MSTTEITLTLDKAVEKVRGHRVRGELKEAFELLNQFLKDHLGSIEVVREAWVICLLTEQVPQGRILLDLLRKFPQAISLLDRSWLLAHERLTGDRPPELDQAQQPGPAWCSHVASLRNFKEFEPRLGGLELACEGGVAVFAFSWTCPACGLEHKSKSTATLEFLRFQHCPGCAAPQLLHGGALADEVLKNHPMLAEGPALNRADVAANQLQDAVGHCDDPQVPALCRMLNQETVSFFNECLFRRIVAS
ncbi:MAG: hypothetical protein AB7F75_10600 [Planctomycetota bacterium]